MGLTCVSMHGGLSYTRESIGCFCLEFDCFMPKPFRRQLSVSSGLWREEKSKGYDKRPRNVKMGRAMSMQKQMRH